jgi:hypothetical protein
VLSCQTKNDEVSETSETCVNSKTAMNFQFVKADKSRKSGKKESKTRRQ